MSIQARTKMHQQKMETLKDIQASIMSELRIAQKATPTIQLDVYRDALLAAIKARGRFWSWKLLLVPFDGDFVYLAYRIIMGREVDQQGYLHFQTELAVGMQTRTDVIRTLMLSPEKQRSKEQPLAGNYLFLITHEVNRIFCKIPIISELVGLMWVAATALRRASRSELLIQSMKEELLEVKLRSIDTVEYLHNQEKRNSHSRLADNTDPRIR